MKLKYILLVIFLISCIVFFSLPRIIDHKVNGIYPYTTDLTSYKVPDFYKNIDVSDMHADTLLWNRSLLKKSEYGHIDLPRMVKGGMALEVFSVVTKVPRGFNIEKNNSNTDYITLLAMSEVWPQKTWFHLLERALYQADQFKKYAQESEGDLRLVTNKTELKKFLEERKTNKKIVAGILSIEGSHAIEGQLGGLDILYDKGFRMLSPTHLFDSEISGSASGEQKGGLTEFGKKWVQKMNEKKLIIDLAHASEKTIDEILQLSGRPLVVSHTGVKGACNNNRNLSDEILKKISEKGGMIGIGFWKFATCGEDIKSIARAIKYAVETIGTDHVALGSDFDGAVSTPMDSTKLGSLAGALLDEGLNEYQIKKIMSENFIEFLLNNLPD